MAMERFSVSLWRNLYQVTQWPSSSSAYTPHPWERLGRILLSCSPCPDFYMGKTSSYNPDENKPCPTEVLVWVSGRLAPLNTSWHIWKPKSRHKQTVPPPAPLPTQSLNLGEAYLWSFKEGQSYFPNTTAQKQFILGEGLLGFSSGSGRSTKTDVHLSESEWQTNLFSASSKKSRTSGVVTFEASLFKVFCSHWYVMVLIRKNQQPNITELFL